jgi:RNA polymerase sigma-B factor
MVHFALQNACSARPAYRAEINHHGEGEGRVSAEAVVNGGPIPAEGDREWRTRGLVEQMRECLARSGGVDRREVERRLRQELALTNTAVARSIAARYRGRGVPREDLEQSAYLGLVKAANGFDPNHGQDFLSFAVPTITGEVKRYFRDHTWMVRPPRRLQELRVDVIAASARLGQDVGRSPSIREVAAELNVSEDNVIESLASAHGYHARSLDEPLKTVDGASAENHRISPADLLGEDDPRLDLIEKMLSLKPLLAHLSSRSRRILILSFFQDLTQAQIGEQVGVTQTQVSRLIKGALDELRQGLLEKGA